MTRAHAIVLGACSLCFEARAQAGPEYTPADSPVALGLTVDVMFADQSDELFVKDGPLLSYGGLLSFDLATFQQTVQPIVVSLDLGYRVAQYSADDLFGGAVTTAITTHKLYAGSTVRVLSSAGPDPTLSYHGRLGLGGAFGPLELRDARAGGLVRSDPSCTPFVDLAIGLTIRVVGLVFETGFEWSGTRNFEPASGAQDRVEVNEGGFFVRTAVLVRVP